MTIKLSNDWKPLSEEERTLKFKSGKWARNKYNEIFQLDRFHIEMHHMVERDYFANIADTPQELVQTGDLVFITNSGYSTIVQNVTNDSVWTFQGIPQPFMSIIKIFTLNENGDYIKQWEEEK